MTSDNEEFQRVTFNHDPVDPVDDRHLGEIAVDAFDTAPWLAKIGVSCIGVGIIGGVLYLLIWLLSLIFSGLGWLLGQAGHGIAFSWHWLTLQHATHVLGDPIHTYLDAHAPSHVTANTLFIGWGLTTGVLLVAAAAGSWGARIGWTLIGALTVAMVHAGTAGPSRNLAAGIAVCAWALLSIAAFRGAWRSTGDVYVVNKITTPAPADTDN